VTELLARVAGSSVNLNCPCADQGGRHVALLHLDDPRQGVVGPTVFGSDRQGEVVERDGQPLAGRRLDRQLIVASPDVLHERMTGNADPGATVLLESSHRSQPCLQAAVVGLDPVVGVLLGAVPGRWRQVLQHDRVGCRSGHCCVAPAQAD
jgi:hypothetical protein